MQDRKKSLSVKARRLWLSRDSREDSDYEVWAHKPDRKSHSYIPSVECDYDLVSFEPGLFEEFFGKILNPGECRQVRVTIGPTRKPGIGQ